MADLSPIDLQKALSGMDYPTDKKHLVERARKNKADEKVVIHAQKNMYTTVENDDEQTVLNDRTISVKGKQSETIKGHMTTEVQKAIFNQEPPGTDRPRPAGGPTPVGRGVAAR